MSCDPDTIFKALRPVPEFDGNPNVLTRFIKLCDQIVSTYLSNVQGSELGNLCLLNGILNKITGVAATRINSNGIPDSWAGIRNTLINSFADQRDETALYNDLLVSAQGNSTPQEYYDQCQSLFSTIMTYISLHETVTTTIEAKRTLYKKLTMQAFVRGLKEPLGSRIRCMRPESIERALEFVQEELNVMYLQNRNDSASVKRPLPTAPMPKLLTQPTGFLPMSMPKPFGHQPFSNWQRPPAPQSSWRQPMFQPHGAPRAPNAPNNQTRTQQMFRAAPPNYNAQSNVFRVQPRALAPGPQPMSGVSHFVAKPMPSRPHDWGKFGNPAPTNYFKTREMNFNDCSENNYDYYLVEEPYSYDYDHADYNVYYDDGNHYYVQDFGPAMVPEQKPIQPSTACEDPQPSTSNANQDFQIKSPLKPST